MTRRILLATEPPDITEDVFEDFLVTDDLLVEYFNEFLSLPTFTEAIKYNKVYGVFEVVSHFPDELEQKIKKVLREHQPTNPIYNATRTTMTDNKPRSDLNIDNNYNIMCLNQEQGVQWIKKERLPAFLQSDCYFEYRLAKLMSQVKVTNTGRSLQIDSQYQPWTQRRDVVTPTTPETVNEEIMRKFFVTLGQASYTQTKEWFTIAKESEPTATTRSVSGPITWGPAKIQTTFTHKLNSKKDVPGTFSSHNANLHQTVNTPWSYTYEEDNSITMQDPETEYSVSTSTFPFMEDRNIPLQDPEIDDSVSTATFPSSGYIDPKEKLFSVEEESKQGRTIPHDPQNPNPKVPVFPTIEDFAFYYVDRIMKSAVSKANGETEKCIDEVDIFDLSEVTIQILEKKGTSSITSEATIEDDISVSGTSESGIESDFLDSLENKKHYSHIHSLKVFEKFKTFLKGTSGETLVLLWMDIERLKTLKVMKKKQSHINKMKQSYLVAASNHYLQPEVLKRLDLLNTNKWNESHLHISQREIVKPLLLYWGPRFCSGNSALMYNVGGDIRLQYDHQIKPKRDVEHFIQTVAQLPHRPKSCMPRIPTSSSTPFEKSQISAKNIKSATRPGVLISAKLTPQKRQAKSLPGSAVQSLQTRTRFRPMSSDVTAARMDAWSTGQKSLHVGLEDDISNAGVLSCSKTEDMLQALNLDHRAGYYFATFCEQSGNKLWENCVYFWFDLQSYHHSFYQETLQPFKLWKQSQSIFANYIVPSATMNIGLHESIRMQIYQKLVPPFEDLFDSAEEYVLTHLLSAWIQMTETDRQTYEKVELVEVSRQLESANYRKLQALRKEKVSKRDEDQHRKPTFFPLPDKPKEPNLWEHVPVEYRNYNLGTLLRHRMDLELFRTFLDDNFASTDLMCWIDLEQLRRMAHKEKEKRLEKSKDIKNKYLNRKYFFGPNSPATRDQQEQVMQLAGGWGKILHECLALPALVEIQKYVRMRIEKKWLPMFLSTEQYKEQKKLQSQVKDVAEDLIFQTNKKKLGVWKHLDNKWISSSKEIIAFRKALLNPVTANQFQRYLALKGNFLENGLLFWQEVQRYKDLCHSHSEESTIQSKITTIINCFINSSIPPALQIDIPPEQAQRILERRRDLGPYVFREAQMTIFSVLFKFWPEFCDFRGHLSDEKILPLLERKKAKRMELIKRRKKEQEKLIKQQEDSRRKETLSDIYRDNESAYSEKHRQDTRRKETLSDIYDDYSEDLFTDQKTSRRSRNVYWTYSKYMEALEQERMLIKMQQDLEKSSECSFMSESSSYSMKTEDSKGTSKTFKSHQPANIQRIQSATRRL